MKDKTLRECFVKYDGDRDEVTNRAYEQAQYTIPRLFNERYRTFGYDTWDLPELYSSRPAANVMSLSSMMTQSLFPPNDTPFFELRVGRDLPEEQRELFRDPLAEVEAMVLDVIQSSNFRSTLFTALQHAIVLGDTLILQTGLDTFKVYHLANFVLRRDGDGNIKEIYTQDWVVTDLLDDDLKNINKGRKVNETHEHEPLYTRIYKEGDKWKSDREFRDVKYETGAEYDTLPYYHIGWSPIAGEDYSRSLVEENMGDIRSLEMASKALAEGIAAGSEGRIVVNSSGPTTKDDIGDTNWSIISARPEDISTFQPNVSATVGIALEAVRYYENKLDEAFLSSSVSDLRGERVTAFQTNAVVNEQGRKIGGVLTSIEQNLEAVVRRTIDLLVKEDKIISEFKEAMDDNDVTLHIASGVDALGKQADVVRIQNMLELALSSQVPEMIEVLNFTNIMQGYARSSGLDMKQYTYNDEQLAERRQQQQQRQVNEQANQQLIQTAGAVAEQQLGNA